MNIKFEKSRLTPEVTYAINAVTRQKLALYGRAGDMIRLEIMTFTDTDECEPCEHEWVVATRLNSRDPQCVGGFGNEVQVRKFILDTFEEEDD